MAGILFDIKAIDSPALFFQLKKKKMNSLPINKIKTWKKL
jgi:hypothetical protein